MENRSLRVGVDIGGTFTDLVLSMNGRLHIHKLLSTPQNPAEAMLAGLDAITSNGLAALNAAAAMIAHGSTVATNAILERKGARTAFLTTQGFRDLLFIGRQDRPVLYALQPQLAPPLVPRGWCYEVPERLDYRGDVLVPLDLTALDLILDEMVAEGIESIAVCFLYSYVNPAHERAARERILARGTWQEWQVALSSDVLPEFREYERASTVVLDAYVRPVMSRYLQRLEDQLPPRTALRVMKSDGGVVSVKRAREGAIQTALSGPAAGVIGAAYVASLAGYDHILTLDIGGTSTDVALCPGGPVRRPESTIDGLPLRIRLIDIETVGAGGGSIARLDAGGALRVGPESAGADPGPVAYGRGGQQVTVSDANAVLGRLDPAYFLGGTMTLDVDAARTALEPLAASMGLSLEAAAQGIIDVANVNIDRALRRVSVARVTIRVILHWWRSAARGRSMPVRWLIGSVFRAF
jgi:N-methylhydantoinase A